MNCEVCHKEVIEYKTKRGSTYKANPLDKSPHVVKSGEDVFCVYSWGEFIVFGRIS